MLKKSDIKTDEKLSTQKLVEKKEPQQNVPTENADGKKPLYKRSISEPAGGRKQKSSKSLISSFFFCKKVNFG